MKAEAEHGLFSMAFPALELLSRWVLGALFLYAGAQKNIGPAGLTVVIIRKDLVGNAAGSVPSMLDYAVHADADSMSNTPPTYAWYLAGLVFQWLKEQGGLAGMRQGIFEGLALVAGIAQYVGAHLRRDRQRPPEPPGERDRPWIH